MLSPTDGFAKVLYDLGLRLMHLMHCRFNDLVQVSVYNAVPAPWLGSVVRQRCTEQPGLSGGMSLSTGGVVGLSDSRLHLSPVLRA